MTVKKPQVRFNAEEAEDFAYRALKEHGKVSDVIGAQIFSILEQHGRVLYYPLDDEDIWGFVEKKAENFFICINTSIDYDKQVFVAAHELYHVLLKDCSEELTFAQDKDTAGTPSSDSDNEQMANRFAAAFLINVALLQQEMQALRITTENLNLHRILRLAKLFTVPYKTMVRRLFEAKMIDAKAFDAFINVSHEEIDIMKKRMGLMTPKQDRLISLDNLNETAMQLYESNHITIEKLTYALSFSNLKPQDMGVEIPDNTPLTDEEIDVLLEE